MARETQKAKIDRLEQELEKWKETVDKLNKEVIEIADNSFLNSALHKQLLRENSTLRATVESKDRIVNILEDKVKNINAHKLKNERGAGRKEKFSSDDKEKMKMYRLQGKSFKETSELYHCSVGLIYKIIN